VKVPSDEGKSQWSVGSHPAIATAWPGHKWKLIAAVVDTGYSGFLTLPPRIIRALRLPRLGRSDGFLADGSEISFDVYGCDVVFNGRRLEVEVDEADTDPLLGTELLRGTELSIQFLSRGKVDIRTMRERR